MIKTTIRNLFHADPYYIRITRDLVSVNWVNSNYSFECAAKISFDGSDLIVSVGDPIAPDAVRTIEPFKHPRSAIDDYDAADKIIKYAVRHVAGKRYLRASPIMVMHADMNLEGGLTSLEKRALQEIAEGSGARKVIIHEGHQLTDDEVKAIASGPSTGTG